MMTNDIVGTVTKYQSQSPDSDCVKDEWKDVECGVKVWRRKKEEEEEEGEEGEEEEEEVKAKW